MISGKSKNRTRISIFGVLLITACISVVYFGVLDRWWFEDDPLQYAQVLQIENPISIFTDPVRLRNFGTGGSLVPMQMLSYWVDVNWFGIVPKLAYCHNVVAYLVVSVLIFLILKLVLASRTLAFIGTVVWALLPSSLAVMQFIATRHYMEGLAWTLLVAYLVLRREKLGTRTRQPFLLLVGCLSLLAMLSKEIYVPLVSVFLFFRGSARKEQRGYIIVSVFIMAFYILYWLYLIRFTGSYPVPVPTPLEYFMYLAVLPYTFSAELLGYLVYAALIALIVLDIRRNKRAGWLRLGPFLLFLGAILLVTFPASRAVLINYRDPGTWYRIPFAYNLLLLYWLVYMARQMLGEKRAVGLMLVIVVLVLPGTGKARAYWETRMERAGVEGRFYLKNPDKLMLTEEEAYWFIPGVDALYRVNRPHYIQHRFLGGDHAKAMLAEWQTIWRFCNGAFVADAELYQEIAKTDRHNTVVEGLREPGGRKLEPGTGRFVERSKEGAVNE